MRKSSRRWVGTFSAASLLNDSGADMIKPLWPSFITGTLGASASFLGLVDGLGQLISFLTRFPFGYYSDRWRRKPFVWMGYLLAAISRLGYALAATPAGAFFAHIVDRTGKGMRDAPRDAILAHNTAQKERGQAFGTLRAADNLGATIGPLLAVLLVPIFGLQTLFLLAAIPSVVAASLVFFLIKEKRATHDPQFHFHWKELSKEYKAVFWISGLFGLSWFSISFLILFATTKGVSVAETPLLYLVYSLTATSMAIPAGKLSDAIGRKVVLMAGYTIYGISLASFTLVDNPPMFYILFFLYGLQYGIIETLQRAYISDLVKDVHRASAIGLFEALWGLSLLPASLIAGLLWDNVSPIAPFLVGAAIATISIILFAWKVPEPK